MTSRTACYLQTEKKIRYIVVRQYNVLLIDYGTIIIIVGKK